MCASTGVSFEGVEKLSPATFRSSIHESCKTAVHAFRSCFPTELFGESCSFEKGSDRDSPTNSEVAVISECQLAVSAGLGPSARRARSHADLDRPSRNAMCWLAEATRFDSPFPHSRPELLMTCADCLTFPVGGNSRDSFEPLWWRPVGRNIRSRRTGIWPRSRAYKGPLLRQALYRLDTLVADPGYVGIGDARRHAGSAL
jgi:hypothetical protein